MSVALLEPESPPAATAAPLTHAGALASRARGVPALPCAGELVPVRVTPHLSRYRCGDCHAELMLREGVVVGVDYRRTVRLLAGALSARRGLKPEPPEYVLLGREDDRYRPVWE